MTPAPAPSADRRIRGLRPEKPRVDPRRPIGFEVEVERQADGRLLDSLTVFLAGRECPFTCVFCDLWRYTTDAPTPPGAIPEQIRIALDATRDHRRFGGQIKLYNASNYFDARAVPPADDPEVIRLVEDFESVVVECHAKLIGPRCFSFAERLGGRLQVAMGFETAHPEALDRLNKRVGLEDLRRAAARLRDAGIGLRAFVLVGTPFIPREGALRWVERSVAFALEQGAEQVVLIPVRGGEGELLRLEREGSFTPPSLDDIEAAVALCAPLAPGAVWVDGWDLERFAGDARDADFRIARLRNLQLSGAAPAAADAVP